MLQTGVADIGNSSQCWERLFFRLSDFIVAMPYSVSIKCEPERAFDDQLFIDGAIKFIGDRAHRGVAKSEPQHNPHQPAPYRLSITSRPMVMMESIIPLTMLLVKVERMVSREANRDCISPSWRFSKSERQADQMIEKLVFHCTSVSVFSFSETHARSILTQVLKIVKNISPTQMTSSRFSSCAVTLNMVGNNLRAHWQQQIHRFNDYRQHQYFRQR